MLERLESLSPREKAGLVLAAVALLGVLGDQLVARPILTRLKAMDTETQRERQNVMFQLSVLQTGEAVTSAFEQVSKELGEGAKADTDIEMMKADIDEMARRTDMLVVSMKHREPRRLEDACIEYAVDIGGFESNMQSLLMFLDAVKRYDGPGILQVSRLSINPGREEGTIKGAMTLTRVMLAPAPAADGEAEEEQRG